MDRGAARTMILDGIGSALSRWVVALRLTADQRSMLKAQRLYWTRASVELDNLIALMPPEGAMGQLSPQVLKQQLVALGANPDQ